MNGLRLYYSYIKSPYSTQISEDKTPKFILDISNCIHMQIADELFLFIRIFTYYFIMQDILPLEKYVLIDVNSRGPPCGEVSYGS